MTQDKINLSTGEWTARILDDGICEIIDPAGELRAQFAHAQIMAVHCAMMIEENDRLQNLLSLADKLIGSPLSDAKAFAADLAAAISPCCVCKKKIRPDDLVNKLGNKYRHAECKVKP